MPVSSVVAVTLGKAQTPYENADRDWSAAVVSGLAIVSIGECVSSLWQPGSDAPRR